MLIRTRRGTRPSIRVLAVTGDDLTGQLLRLGASTVTLVVAALLTFAR